MKKNIKMRRVQVWRKSKWMDCQLQDIQKGEKFRMFEPDGKRVRNGRRSVSVALAKPVFDKGSGLWGVKADA